MADDIDPEKRSDILADSLSGDIIDDSIYARVELIDPDRDETLHRGLVARQITMIAVS